ncbi:helix-turn-helix domain-containing protein [Hymenobacter psychrotolerans]|uniref:Helix-turn-helix domain-containing protein n=1 Tax=Hymenobacter psychrotolerans DSM 18569 TaxID=1121959 RepID=A0A1M6THT0_9BACT|nr:helix-turn-helix domain-containing protein [Hymenobacter psychrotolerans]SHK56612.1 Helix-turn-helix domain-containing protein [Hymenobacter psychrotolerans DSM 18569]
MPRRARPSTHVIARLRDWFGLTQDELALYLGLSAPLVRDWETRRRPLTPAAVAALQPLLACLPPPAPDSATPPPTTSPSTTPPPEAGALRFRARQCRQQAAGLQAQAGRLQRQAVVAARWAEALPGLLAAPAPEPAHAAWQADWLRRRARPLPPEAATRWHLLTARAAALLLEAATLEALLPEAG